MFARLFGSMKVQVAFLAFLVSAMVLFGVSAENQAKAMALAAAAFGLAGAVIIATGYEDGQEKSASNNSAPGNGPPPPPAAPMLAIMIAGLALFALGGCANPNLPLVTGASELATIEVIAHQPPAKQVPLAQAALAVATAASEATAVNPDLTTVKSYTRPAIAKEIAKLAPADGIVVQLLADAALDTADAIYLQAISSATATDKGKLAQSIEQAALTGIQLGAQQFLVPKVPPATQPQ